MEFLFYFVFFYPLFMAYFWMIGSLIFYMRRERGRGGPPPLKDYPFVSILVPCHNEAATIGVTMAQLQKNNYPNFEVIAINDGSSDATDEVLNQLAKKFDKLRIITLAKNYGKAMALRSGAMASEAEFLMCIDADALLDRHAIHWMMLHFQDGPRVGAVTGHPRVLNKKTLLSRIQVGEFSAIIGMVKRSQRDIGRLFTVSGVNVCYRRRALHDVGYWSPETVTEDIDISWKLQLKYWDIRYEPRSLTWIFVPESVNGLWRQRLRWARGGAEAALKYAYLLKQWNMRRMWPVYIEYLIGALWCYAFVATVLFWAATHLLGPDYWPRELSVDSLLPGWTGVLLAVTCLLQFIVGFFLDSHYEKGILKNLYWAIWYPAVYWMLSCLTTVVAVPRAIYGNGTTRYVTWKSPKRRGARMAQANMSKLTSWRVGAELVITALFWGIWIYFILPLVSLMLWLVGIFIFVEQMVLLGGYESFLNRLFEYGLVILGMMALTLIWINWNKQHYGSSNKRSHQSLAVTDKEIAEFSGASPETIKVLHRRRHAAVYFDDRDRLVVTSA